MRRSISITRPPFAGRLITPAFLLMAIGAAGCGRPYEPGTEGPAPPVHGTTTSAPAQPAGPNQPRTPTPPSTPAPAPAVDCSTLDEQACRAEPSCRVDSCPACNGGDGFVRCSSTDDGPVGCPGGCGRPACSNFDDETSCRQQAFCHPTYTSHECQADCLTSPCCSEFAACAEGATVSCDAASATCDAVQPYCEAPLVISIGPDGCYNGCVYPDVCQ
jgi:hypothetical protein